jgi:hypothetical protein
MLVRIGCGTTEDALTGLGMSAVAYDVVGTERIPAQRLAARLSGPSSIRPLRLADIGTTLAEGAWLACIPASKTVLVRLALDLLPAEDYDNLWRFLRLCTARGGAVFIESRAEIVADPVGTAGGARRRTIDVPEVAARAARIGGRVTEHSVTTGDPASGASTPMWRFAVHFEPGGSAG